MNLQIKKLLKLQTIDYERYNLKEEKFYKPKILDSIKLAADEVSEKLKQSEENLKKLELLQKAKEINLNSKEEQIEKYQTQLYQIKSNKEYSSLQHEIEALKADNSVLEEEIINLLDKIDEQKEIVRKKRERLDDKKREFQNKKKEVELDTKEIDQRIDTLNAQRKEITKDIEEEIFAIYEKVLENRQGDAMARIVNGTCGGCYMNLPPQIENEVRLGKILTCQNCSRILYLEEN